MYTKDGMAVDREWRGKEELGRADNDGARVGAGTSAGSF